MAIAKEVNWPLDIGGVVKDLRDGGIRSAQRLYTDEQLKTYLGVLKLLAGFAKESLADRKAMLAMRSGVTVTKESTDE